MRKSRVANLKLRNLRRPTLRFEKITQKFGRLENRISSEKILENISATSGNKTGYLLKNIVIPPNKSDFANVRGNKPYLRLEILRAGIFTAKLILEKRDYPDVEIPNCEFEIEKRRREKFKFSETFSQSSKNGRFFK